MYGIHVGIHISVFSAALDDVIVPFRKAKVKVKKSLRVYQLTP